MTYFQVCKEFFSSALPAIRAGNVMPIKSVVRLAINSNRPSVLVDSFKLVITTGRSGVMKTCWAAFEAAEAEKK